MSLHLDKKSVIISNFGREIKDSGSTEVQIALLTSRINRLQYHFTTHNKDHHSRHGLKYIVSRRRKFLRYLKEKNIISYNNLVKLLGIRH